MVYILCPKPKRKNHQLECFLNDFTYDDMARKCPCKPYLHCYTRHYCTHICVLLNHIFDHEKSVIIYFQVVKCEYVMHYFI